MGWVRFEWERAWILRQGLTVEHHGNGRTYSQFWVHASLYSIPVNQNTLILPAPGLSAVYSLSSLSLSPTLIRRIMHSKRTAGRTFPAAALSTRQLRRVMGSGLDRSLFFLFHRLLPPPPLSPSPSTSNTLDKMVALQQQHTHGLTADKMTTQQQQRISQFIERWCGVLRHALACRSLHTVSNTLSESGHSNPMGPRTAILSTLASDASTPQFQSDVDVDSPEACDDHKTPQQTRTTRKTTENETSRQEEAQKTTSCGE